MRSQSLAEQLKTEFLGRKEILYPMINNSGGALVAGNVVLIDTTLDRAVTIGTTGADYVCGLVVIGGINGAIVWVASFGVWPVIVDAGGCANGDGLAISSASAGEAMTVGALPSAAAIFAMALETVASGLCMCELRLPASVAGGSLSIQHSLLSGTHPDTQPKSPPDRGDIIVARGSAPSVWTAVVAGNPNDILQMAGVDPQWHDPAYYVPVAPASQGDILVADVNPAWAVYGLAVPALNVRNVLGVDNAEVSPTWKAALDATNPTTIMAAGVAAPGTSLIFSHRDHTHGITASPALVGAGTAAGQVIIAGAGPGFAPGWSAFTLSGTGALALGVTAGKSVTLTATDTSSIVFTGACALTIPTAGAVTAALLGTANVFTVAQTIQYASGLGGATPVTLTIYSTDDGTWTAGAIYSQLLFGNADTGGSAGTKGAIKAVIGTKTNGTDCELSFWTTTNGATGLLEAMRIDHQGFLGIGTTTPAAPLHVVGSAQNYFDRYVGTSGTVSSGVRYRTARGTVSVPVANSAGDFLGAVNFAGYWTDGTPGFGTTFALIVGYAEEAITSTAQGSGFAFWTTPIGTVGGTGTAERMRITAGGLVGVGATIPLAQVHMAQASATGAIPVLLLDQADEDKPYTKYVGATAANWTKPISTLRGGGAATGPLRSAGGGGQTGWLFAGMARMDVNGATVWMPYYTEETT